MKIGDIYRYGRPYDAGDAERDGLPNFFHHTYLPGAKFPLLEKGINRIAQIKVIDGKRIPAILISSSPHKFGSHDTPWQDFYDLDNGHIRYFGDNKTPGTQPEKKQGNTALLKAQLAHESLDKMVRMQAVPLIFFKRVSYDGRLKGNLLFQGYGIIRSSEKIIQSDKKGQTFNNYAYDFTVLHMLDEPEAFNWGWINKRRDPNYSIEDTLKFAPVSWRNWIEEGEISIKKARHRITSIGSENPNEIHGRSPVPTIFKDFLSRQL